ncbi:TraR/DksA C4-type zinc finger protein [Botrimarina hoheduenensis]|uniref:TraR/DksA C4-type zinc finger protein n=1 Tax=Botrimarina hoheduenensis TaxID=2528000 RepID=UPI0011B4F781|nr:TraR/DksA C4-type zinc finger protein [Botrimarina hoheduenensis]
MLRRAGDPDPAIVGELLREAAPRMTCPSCKSIGLTAKSAAAEDEELDDWQAAILCEACRKPIPTERLEALPSVKRCATCQKRAEAGHTDDEPDFCPRCGALMELRVSRGSGLTRYRLFCTGVPACRST